MSVKERVKQFVRFERISMSEFCRSIGVSVSYVSSMRSSIQPDKIDSIALKYPRLNTGWLLTGEGEMIKKIEQPEMPVSVNSENGGDKVRIEMLMQQIDDLKKENKKLLMEAAILEYKLSAVSLDQLKNRNTG